MNDVANMLQEFVGREMKSPPQQQNPFNFMEAVKTTLADVPSVTENGAVGYKTTGKALLDINFQISSLRQKTPMEICKMFDAAYYENPLLAWKWLFYLRDIRGGQGERRSFRIILEHMADIRPKETAAVIPFIAEYGRYDDIWILLKTPLKPLVVQLIAHQLTTDLVAYQNDKSLSLLAKWLPSRNASSKTTREYAQIIIDALGTDVRTYCKTLSMLRERLRITEVYMSSNRWTSIDYNAVPSRANLRYNNAFLKHDEERRRAFLSDLEQGKEGVKINAGTLYPHDIVHKYGVTHWDRPGQDATLEALWKALPDTVEGAANIMVVADGSGSMGQCVDLSSRVSALEVANSLAIYFAERCSGVYKDNYITFSEHPQYVSFKNAATLYKKIRIALQHCEVANTNIEAVFDLILETATKNHLVQDQLPKSILIISDMEFDGCAVANPIRGSRYGHRIQTTLFAAIRKKYQDAGYKMPRLVFWNVASRTGTIPVRENDMGVALVSGFSVNTVKMVMSDKLDPYECLLEQINSERYQPIGDAISEVRNGGDSQ